MIRKDWMPYPNLLPPFIALETQGRLWKNPDTFAAWFWYSGFAGSYDAAANTRLVSHFKNVRDGDDSGYRLDERRAVEFLTATRKNEKALWNAAVCATVLSVEERCGTLPPAIVEELEVSTLFSGDEVSRASAKLRIAYDPDLELRSIPNAFLVPRRLAAVVRKAGAVATVQICKESEFGDYAAAQLTVDIGNPPDWNLYRAERSAWLAKFAISRGVKNVRVSFPDPDNDLTSLEHVEPGSEPKPPQTSH